MTWLYGSLGIAAVLVAVNRLLRRRYREMYGSVEPPYKEPPVAPDLGWPGGR